MQNMLRFENKENGRFYYLRLEKDVTDADILVIVRGGRNVRVTRSYSFDSRQDCEKKIRQVVRRRIRHGYTLVM